MRVSGGVFAAIVGVALVQPVVFAPVASATPVPDVAANEVLAQKLAKEGGKSVRIASRMTETEDVSAQPDGSLVWREYARPVRVKRGDGWVDVDVTLAKRADGTVGPKASNVDLTLSGGGQGSRAAGPLVKVGSGTTEVGLAWESDLPVPSLDGATATYPEVWPGVDLKVTADTMGFSQVLVVKNAEAAKNPKLAKITFGSYTRNTTVQSAKGKGKAKTADASGQTVQADGLDVVDSTGAVVFAGDASRMWDSSGADGERDKLLGSAAGTRRAAMGTEVTDAGVVISPDAAFLADKATTYPVFIDPEYYCSNTSWCGKQHHVVTQSGFRTAHNFDATGGDFGDLKAGYENYDSAGTSHSYIAMNTAPVLGKFIHWARLDVPVVHTASCSPGDTELWLAGGIDGNTTWDSQPGLIYRVSNSNVANCRDAGGVTASWDATGPVRDAVNGGWTTTTFGLKGTDYDEDHRIVASWRRFGLNPYLEVNYNSQPNNPANHSMQLGAVPCVKGDGRPWLDTRTPELQASVSDPDGGSLSVLIATSGGQYGHDVPNSYHDNNSTRPWIGTPGQNQGATAQMWVPDGWITGDGIYKWAMRVSDGAMDSPRWDWDCEFYVDTAVPPAPTVALTGTAPQLQGDTANFSVSVPLATAGLDDIDRFVYTTDGSDPSVQGSPSVPRSPGLDSGGKVTATLAATAANGNQNLIRVKAVNKTGKPGPNGNCLAGNGLDAPSCSYNVLPLTPEKELAGSWGIDETGGQLVGDNVMGLRADAHPASPQGDAAWWLGYSKGNSWTQPDAGGAKEGTKGGMRFTSTGYLATSGRVLDTSKSFTISAWAKALDANPNTWHAVISQDGVNSSGAFIEYSSDADAWTFNLPDCDCNSPANPHVVSKAPPQVGVWTHLVGTYDAASGLATLYVDGVKQNSLVRKGFASGGPLTIGALKWNGIRTAFFNGMIDDAQVWQRALSAEDVRNLANASVSRAQYGLAEGAAALLTTGSTGTRDSTPDSFVPAPVPNLKGYWKFDEATGTSAADAGNNGNGFSMHPAALTGGSTWVAGKTGGGVHFDGTGYAQTDGQVVDTSSSFTVSAWVKLDDVAGYWAVMGQHNAATGIPGFMMRYSPDVKTWIFGVNSDQGAAQGQMNWAYQENAVAPQAGVWTLVTGVYNSETKQIQAFVNGKQAGRSTYQGSPWNAVGPLSIGAYDVGGMTGQMKGSVDQVQAWQQALTPSQIAGLAGLPYQDATWNISGSPVVTPTGNVAEVATKGDTARAQFAWDGTVQAARPDSFRTDKSYTAEAWVKQDATDDYTRDAISVDDGSYAPFMLGFRKDNQPEGRWALGVSCSSSQACLKVAWSDAKAERGVWTHLATTYDAVTNTGCLYVNGIKQSSCVTGMVGLNSVGDLRLGKTKWAGGLVDFWHGGIAGVRVYSGVRAGDQIKDDRTADDPGRLFGTKH
ncbi:MAG: LamG-like jellyroll fold domain-containing protein [Umezawaea sp.]